MVKIAWYSAMESHMMIYLQLRHHTRPTKRIQVSNQQFDEQYNLKNPRTDVFGGVEQLYRTVALHPPKTSFTFKHQSRNAITAETIRFTFSRFFGPETSQMNFFQETSLNVVKDFINGQNCLVFSYGITHDDLPST